VKFVVEVLVTLAQTVLSFYGFWLIWRVLLPELPGPPEPEKRIAPYVAYFTDPFVQPVARALHAPPRLIALIALTVVAIAGVTLGRLPELAA
jgi:hypothetical protein